MLLNPANLKLENMNSDRNTSFEKQIRNNKFFSSSTHCAELDEFLEVSDKNHQNLPITTLIDIINNGGAGVEYQPILDASTLEIYGYEALARFFDSLGNSFSPDIVFASLHNYPDLLFDQEYQHKELQLRFAPVDKKCFVNIDKDSFFGFSGEYQCNPFLDLFKNNKNQLIVEITENSRMLDAIGSRNVISILNKNCIVTAIDDALKPNSIFSVDVLPLIDFIKLDKYVVDKGNRENQGLLSYLLGIIDYAHKNGKKLVLEGIENEEDLIFARSLKVDYVQGFLFRRKFINYYAKESG